MKAKMANENEEAKRNNVANKWKYQTELIRKWKWKYQKMSEKICENNEEEA